MDKTMTLLAGAVSSALSGVALADIKDIVITEYLEPQSGSYAQNAALEISNLGDQDFTFNQDGDAVNYTLYYQSGRYINAIQTPQKTNVLDGVTIAANSSIVIINSNAQSALTNALQENNAKVVTAGSYSEVGFNSLNFNGGDPVWIAADAGSGETIHDIIGESSDGWGKNTTLRRARTVQGNPVALSAHDGMQWTSAGSDNFSDLGLSTLAEPPVPPAPAQQVSIADIQGSGLFSPLVEAEFGTQLTEEERYETTASYRLVAYVGHILSEANQGIDKGFFLYDRDGDPLTSDGLFVYSTDTSGLTLGQEITATGKVREYYGQTQFVIEGNWEATGNSITLPAPVDLKRLPEDGDSFAQTLERYEGMVVKLVEDMDDAKEGNQDMRVTRAFSFDYDLFDNRKFRNNIALSFEKPNYHPNHTFVAGSAEAMAQIDKNRDATLILDSETAPENGNLPYYPEFNLDPNANPIRINDGIKNVEGVIVFTHDEYRLVPSADFTLSSSDITPYTPRPERNSDGTYDVGIEDSYGEDGFSIRVATKNVLNYFNSPFGGDDNPSGSNRGAKTEEEFEKQQAKIVEAIYGLDADILGLMELENNGFGDSSAIAQLVNAINAKYYNQTYSERSNINSQQNRYAFVGFDNNGNAILDEGDVISSDAITNGIIYRPSKVLFVAGQIIAMPEQHAPAVQDENGEPLLSSNGSVRESGNNYHRNTVAATFKVHNTDKQVTVAVNHFKSKGSTCSEDWTGWQEWQNFDPVNDDVRNEDYQSSCENFRVSAAYHLGTELAKIGGDQVVLGDMNSYTKEDPMLVLTENTMGKAIYASDHTFVGSNTFEKSGQQITDTFGYINAIEQKASADQSAWSYSFSNEIGSLDHILISPSLETRLIDAKDWHINAAESSLYDYTNSRKEPNNLDNPFYQETATRSSDHDPAMITLGYKYAETAGGEVSIAMTNGRADVGFALSDKAREGDMAQLSISPRPANLELPAVTLTKSGTQAVMFDVAGLDADSYSMTMTLTRDLAAASTAQSASPVVVESKSIQVNTVNSDGSAVVKQELPNGDSSSGGSIGLGALLSLIGLGFLRRRKFSFDNGNR